MHLARFTAIKATWRNFPWKMACFWTAMVVTFTVCSYALDRGLGALSAAMAQPTPILESRLARELRACEDSRR